MSPVGAHAVYDVTQPAGLIAWLANDRANSIDGLPAAPIEPDRRQALRISAVFEVDGSLLIRSGTGVGNDPDMVHLGSFRKGQEVPIVSGTSLAGTLPRPGFAYRQYDVGTEEGTGSRGSNVRPADPPWRHRYTQGQQVVTFRETGADRRRT